MEREQVLVLLFAYLRRGRPLRPCTVGGISFLWQLWGMLHDLTWVGCIVLLSQHSFLFSLSELLALAFHVVLFLFFLASCTVGSLYYYSEQFWFFELSLSLSLAVAFHSCFLDILRPWSMSAPVLCVCNKWIRSVLASGYENPFLYVDKSLSVFDSSGEVLWNSSNFGVGSW
jgi:hypothetical protein